MYIPRSPTPKEFEELAALVKTREYDQGAIERALQTMKGESCLFTLSPSHTL